MRKLIATAAASLALATGAALAGGTPMTEGEVRKVDKDNLKITLKHGEITNLGMPPMTMVFRVGDRALLEGVQAGAKVRFRAEQDGSGYKVTAIEPAR